MILENQLSQVKTICLEYHIIQLMAKEYENLIWTPTLEQIEGERQWINEEISEIGIQALRDLATRAAEARIESYSPYSNYQVGAALLTVSGKEEIGQNIEIVTFSETGHAEEQAVKKAAARIIKDEGRMFIRAIAVSHEGDAAPCGRCRQIISEFSDNSIVIIADTKGSIRNVTSIRTLLPYGFTPSNLETR